MLSLKKKDLREKYDEHDGFFLNEACRKEIRFFCLFPGRRTRTVQVEEKGKTHFYLSRSLI